MPIAGELLRIYTVRLEMDRQYNRWPAALRTSVENFVEKLKALAPEESVEIDSDPTRNPIAMFIETSTGEVLGEINKAPEVGDK